MIRGAGLKIPRVSADVAATLALLLASGLAAVLQGQDANIDLYRYHFYIGYAFVGQRLDHDFAPAALSTYLNPVLDAVHYLGIAILPPRVFAFLLGAFQGLNAVLVLFLARRLLPVDSSSHFVPLVALLAASGPTARSLLGTTLGDTTVSVPVLLGLLLVVRGLELGCRSTLALFLAAGFLGGAALGLKLTVAPALVGLGALVALGVVRAQIPLGSAIGLLSAAVLGYLAVAGYWCWQLWERFGNPLFPFANHIFRSPYLPAEAIRDSRWAARSLADYIVPPVDMALGMTQRLQEIPFRDARLLMVLVAVLLWMGLRLARRRPALTTGQVGLLFFFLVTYALWAMAFYYYRYAAVLEFVAPLVLVVLVQAALPKHGSRVIIATTLFLLTTSSVGSWGRLAWGNQWFHIRLPPQAYELDSLVLIDSSLSSFLVPYFPPATRFAGLEGVGSVRFEQLLEARVASHRGPLMWLVSRGRPVESTTPERFGVYVTEDCGPIRTGEGRWALCRVGRPAGPRM